MTMDAPQGAPNNYTMSDETRKNLAALAHAIEDKIEKLTELEIRTVVGSFDPNALDADGGLKARDGVHVLRTTIDLLDGDIRTELDEWFLTDERKAILDMHMQRERQGGEIIQANVAALKSMWAWANGVAKGSSDAG